jgi:hypothetical protein
MLLRLVGVVRGDEVDDNPWNTDLESLTKEERKICDDE